MRYRGGGGGLSRGGGGVKVNKIDPFAIKTSLTQKTGDQTFE